ncbi:unnamed protein product [Adineta ricciae]|uniref:Uncharacterized protein n=1 Tax=Adineta ricciae TaxID=249248 RepID=A0A815UGH2_ADIRI|nr:unnamed protein product [Adineta ricciae]
MLSFQSSLISHHAYNIHQCNLIFIYCFPVGNLDWEDTDSYYPAHILSARAAKSRFWKRAPQRKFWKRSALNDNEMGNVAHSQSEIKEQ